VLILSCHGFEKFFKREDKNMKRQGLKAFQTGSATAGLLHTYPGISSPEPSSVSTSSVIDRTDQPFFFSKQPLKIIFVNCLLQNGHRSPCISVHRKLIVVYRNLISAYRKLR
jgi:hypothetical protein